MIVVDTHIIVHLHLTGEYSPQACALLEKDPGWAAPLLWRSEFRNVLKAYLRRNFLTLEQAYQIMDSALQTLRGREYLVSSERVLSLAAVSGCSAYDCEFVALAQDLGLRLVTLDREIATCFPETAVWLQEFLGA